MTTFTPTSNTQETSWTRTTPTTTVPSSPEPPLIPPTFLDILGQYPDYRASLALSLYGCSVVMAVGTATNLLTLAVMTRRTMISSTTCFYFAVLALVDLMVLYFACLRRLLYVVNDHHDVYIENIWSCRFLTFLSYFNYDLSSWVITAMTVDRFIAIRYPLKAALVCTIRNAAIALSVLSLLCFAKNFHFFFTFEMSARSGCLAKDAYTHFFENVWPWLDATFYSFLPFSLLFVFNILIIYCHRKALRRKRTLHSSTSQATQRARHGSFNQRLTTMLLVVSFSFMATTAPKVILFIIREDVFPFITADRQIDFPVVARYSLVSSAFNLLLWTNHSINFFLYCLSGKRFRQELTRMLAQCVHRKRHAQVFSAPQPRPPGQPQPQAQALPPHASNSNSRRGSNSSELSDVAPLPSPQLPPETEDAASRVNRWATMSLKRENCA